MHISTSVLRKYLSTTLITWVSVAACADSPDSGDVKVTSGGADSNTVAVSPAPSRDAASLTSDRIAFSKGVEVGVLEGEQNRMFGLISDVAVDHKGRLYVADSRMLNIRQFDTQGNLLGKVGRPGVGPGEFKYMERIDHDGDSTLFAVDFGTRRMTVYRTGAGLRLFKEVGLPVFPRDICVAGNRIFLSASNGPHPIVEIDSSGNVVNGFGDRYAGNEIPPGTLRESLREIMSRVLFACSPDLNRIIAVKKNRPEVVAYDLNGRSIWKATLSGYSALRAVPLENGRVAYTGDPATGGQHTAVGAAILARQNVIVQLAFLNPQNRIQEESPVESRFLDLRTGKELGRTSDLPRLEVNSSGLAVGFENLPYPKAFLGRLTWR